MTDNLHQLPAELPVLQRERLGLPSEMLSDTARRLADELNTATFAADGMTLYKRLTLMIRNGTIEHVFYPIFPPNEHAREVLAWLGNEEGQAT